MRTKRLYSAELLCLVIFRWTLRNALAILLCSAAATASAQSSVSASAVRGSASAKSARESSRAATAIDAGRTVFNQRCEICHYIDSNAQKIGPGLKGLFARARLSDGTRVTEASVAKIIGEGGKDMPDYKGLLKAGQLQALIAYLKSH
jgi:cytochrome c